MKEYLLKEIANVKNGYAFDSNKYSDKGIPIIRIADIKDNIDLSKCVCIDEEINKEFLIKKGSLLIALSGATTGKMSVFSDNKIAYLNQRICSIYTKNEDISQEFLIYFLKSIQKKIIVNSYGGAQPNISSKWIENIKIKVPNIEIQKKISKKLELLANNINSRKSQLVFLKELTKSLFTKYSIGEKESIANLCYVKARIGWQGLTKKEYLSNGEYYLITGVDFKNEKIDFKNCFYVTKERYNQDENIKVKINDILLTKDGTIGKVAIVDKLEKPATLNSGVFVLRPKVNNLNVTYLMHSLISEDFKKFIDDIKIGATVPHLNQAALLKYKLTLPPIELQNKFAERVEKIEKLSFEIEEAIKEAENLYNSLISKYFD